MSCIAGDRYSDGKSPYASDESLSKERPATERLKDASGEPHSIEKPCAIAEDRFQKILASGLPLSASLALASGKPRSKGPAASRS